MTLNLNVQPKKEGGGFGGGRGSVRLDPGGAGRENQGGDNGGRSQWIAQSRDRKKAHGRTDGGRSQDGVSGLTTSSGARRFGDPGGDTVKGRHRRSWRPWRSHGDKEMRWSQGASGLRRSPTEPKEWRNEVQLKARKSVPQTDD